jgi:hypothetical protein
MAMLVQHEDHIELASSDTRVPVTRLENDNRVQPPMDLSGPLGIGHELPRDAVWKVDGVACTKPS